MQRTPLGSVALAFVAGAFFLSANPARAQSNDGSEGIVSRALWATIDYGNDVIFQPSKHGTNFDQYGLDPQQVVTITVAFPVELAGQLILAEPLDAGTLLGISDEGLFVGRDGNVVFQFQA